MEKIRAMVSWPLPQNIKELRGFLGLTGYYWKFVAGYAKIAHPLTQLLKKDSFNWSPEATLAFEELKRAMTTVPILALPDFSKVFTVETDACSYGLGAVLSQENHPIAYFSQTLGPRAKLKSIYEKELMAIVMVVLKWRHYLLGRRFVIKTDQQSLKFLMEQREIGPEYQRWVSKLMGFTFDISYRSGITNTVADALSRKMNAEGECNNMSTSCKFAWDHWLPQIKQDSFVQQVTQDILAGKPTPKGYTVHQDQLLYKGRLVVPAKSPLVNLLLREYHDSPAGGHSGDLKTYQRLATEWFWPGMRRAVWRYVQACSICQQNKYSSLSPGGLLQPLPIPGQVWEEISLDFVEGLPPSQGKDTVLVVVDRLTKYAHFIGLRHPFTAPTVAEVFTKEIIRLHGTPTSIVSDRDKVFLSLFWKEIFKLQGTSLQYSTAYHPQSDGQTEVVNKCLESYLRCFINGKPRTWHKWLHWAEYWYNTSIHSATACTPFKALYGRDPPQIT